MSEFFLSAFSNWDGGSANPPRTAALLAILMVGLWSLAYFRRWGFWVALALFSSLGICLLQTPSRGGIIALFTGLVPILLWAPRPWPKPRIAGAVLCVWVAFGAALFLQSNEQSTRRTRVPDRSITSRLDLWKDTPAMMKDAPGGWGPGNAGKAYMQWYQPLGSQDKTGQSYNLNHFAALNGF